MENFADVNWLAVAVGTIVTFLVGFGTALNSLEKDGQKVLEYHQNHQKKCLLALWPHRYSRFLSSHQ